MTRRVYLDCNATCPIRPEVIDRVGEVMRETGNASSVHEPGRLARQRIETARRQIATAFDVGAQQIVFNSGATEGNNTILRGFAGKRILVSAIEHSSILESGVDVETIEVSTAGIVDLEALRRQLASGPPVALVSVMLVNNETGIIQPVREAAALAHEAGAVFHTDAVQAVGRLPFTRAALEADFVTLSAHKIGGPQGVGAIIMAPQAPLPVLLQGGGQERRQRAGTENVAGISGFGLAVELATAGIDTYQKIAAKRDRLEQALRASSNRVRLHGGTAARVANTISLSVSGVSSETLLLALDLEGIAVSSGSACSSGTVKPSHVLSAMAVDHEDATSSLRLSLGITTTDEDVDATIAAWNKICARLLR